MPKDNTLFDDEFDLDFDDELDSALSGGFDLETQIPEPEPQPEVNIDAPMKALRPASGGSGTGGMPDERSAIREIPAISIMAFCETPEVLALIKAVGADRRMSKTSIGCATGGLDAAIGYLSENVTPNLLILESQAPTNQMIAQIDQLANYCDEGVEVMVIGATNDIQLYRQLMARGVSEYLVPPLQPTQVIRSVSTLFADPDAPFMGKSVAVLGAKGGVGASTLAHNLAWSLSENAGLNTSLIDLDLSFGTTGLDFNTEPQQTVLDALILPERVDDTLIMRLLAKATERLSLFTAPANIGDITEIDTQAYSLVIDSVRKLMPYVVLDLPHMWNTWMFNTLVNADHVILVCQPDLASLRNGKNLIDRITADRPNDVPPRLVLNMMGVPKRPEIPVKDFAAAIGIEPDIVLPLDPQLFGTASNNGQMISETDAQAKPSLAIDHLATLISGRTVQAPQKSFLDKLLKR